MEYSKLPPQPPPYDNSVSPGWSTAPSAPPTEVIHTTPVYVPRPPTEVINVVHQSMVIVDNATQGMICPYCNARVRMTVEHHPTFSTYMYAALLCICFAWPCVCLPCCCKCGYKTTQYCPNCKACLGSF